MLILEVKIWLVKVRDREVQEQITFLIGDLR